MGGFLDFRGVKCDKLGSLSLRSEFIGATKREVGAKIGSATN
ncbi:hypothetical protein HMPREF0653_00202 [Prevotella disiens JCM 6334 = ATCC 29426]|uniref:Uncharacterized protein n=1 Tax=Prevotella disiens JCM 6334 = ATCC 29426 TaxID=1235811 RepID=A0ABN0NV66_9BACT|nr:hypothetical protein HMPREF0653_00202 [Prevotella disiens JCM 6334 = ATCC 29426]